MKRSFAFVFARGGSKGIPRKNLALLAGIPLIAYPIQTAIASGLFERIFVSTDDQEIAEVAKSHGAEVPFIRPADLAADNSSEWAAWQHALNQVKIIHGLPDVFVSLPATSPFRNPHDVRQCVEMLLAAESKTDIIVTGKTADRSPYFNMVKFDERGHVQLINRLEGEIYRRQDAPPVYDLTTVAYAARPDFILGSNSIWDGRVGMVQIPRERALDIDTPFDLFIAECVATRYPALHVT